jgi:hypothetical protein
MRQSGLETGYRIKRRKRLITDIQAETGVWDQLHLSLSIEYGYV